MTLVGAATARRPGFRALLVAQALTAFNHNALRSALLALVVFRGLATFGWSAETIVAVSTILVMAPYFVLSILAGRLADFWPKAGVIRSLMLLGVAVFALAGVGLLTMNLTVLMLALLLAGVQAALLGPAKFAILPELLAPDDLLRGNGWVSASGTVAVVLGLIAGNLLVLGGSGLPLALCGGAVALLAWLISLTIPETAPAVREPEWHWPDVLRDYGRSLVWLRQQPEVIVPILGSSWFWFQAALFTTLFPLFLAQWTDQPEAGFTLLLLAASLGTALGALVARPLIAFLNGPTLSVAAFLSIAVPGLDLWLAAPFSGGFGAARVALDILVMAAGTGLFNVVLTTSVVSLPPAAQRARFIGVNHTLHGLALMASGWAILVFDAAGLSTPEIYVLVALATAGVAAASLAAVSNRHAAARV